MEDDEILQIPRQSHALRFVHPVPQLAHGDGPAVLRFLAVEMIVPVTQGDGILLRDLRQAQRLQQRTDLLADLLLGRWRRLTLLGAPRTCRCATPPRARRLPSSG